MGLVDFLIGTVKTVGRLIFGSSSSSSSSIETEMFGVWFSIGIWAFIIYLFVSLASKPFRQNNEEE
ncbi:MAG: hypothetical protein J0H52_19615 [Comamonadaceae bacterium]|nr:hypothetical protein [Comamonadaceae bacterium]